MSDEIIQTTDETDVQIYYISNHEAFKIAEEQGIDVKEILGAEAYQEALRDDMLRHGGTYVKKYTKNGETRYTIAVNSAIVKAWKYGGKATVWAIKTFLEIRGMPMDPMIYYGMQAQLSSINSDKGHKWEIGTKPWRIISHGVQ